MLQKFALTLDIHAPVIVFGNHSESFGPYMCTARMASNQGFPSRRRNAPFKSKICISVIARNGPRVTSRLLKPRDGMMEFDADLALMPPSSLGPSEFSCRAKNAVSMFV